jgi:hypothetical protein
MKNKESTKDEFLARCLRGIHSWESNNLQEETWEGYLKGIKRTKLRWDGEEDLVVNEIGIGYNFFEPEVDVKFLYLGPVTQTFVKDLKDYKVECLQKEQLFGNRLIPQLRIHQQLKIYALAGIKENGKKSYHSGFLSQTTITGNKISQMDRALEFLAANL